MILDLNFARIIILLFVLTCPNLAVLSQTIPNAGFENWTNAGMFEDPDDWYTPNQVTSIAGVVTVEKTTDKYSGTYAIRLETKNVVTETVPGTAIAGALDPLNLEVIPGFAICSNPVALTGWFKYFPVFLAADLGSVEVLLSKWNSTLNVREPIGAGIFTTPIGTTSSYTSFSFNIIYTSSEIADTAIITLLSGSYTQPPGSVLFIDDLSFTGPVPVPPVANFTSLDNGGGSFDFTDQSTNTPTSWSWTFGDGNVSTIQNPSNQYASTAGSYNVCLTATNCAGTHTFCDSVTVVDTTVITGIHYGENHRLTLFPNPASRTIRISAWPPDATQLEIRDISGRLVLTKTIVHNIYQIDVGALEAGIYFCNLIGKTGKNLASLKFIRKE